MNKFKKFLVGSAAAALLFGSAVSAFAAGTNGSFESGTDPGSYATLPTSSTNITDWTVGPGSVDYIGTYWQASSGVRSIDLSGNESGSVNQVLTTVPGATYNVTFDMSGNPDGIPTVKTLNVDAGGAPTGYSFDTTGINKANMGWLTKTYSFVASGTSTTLTFTSTTSGPFGPALDNVVVTESPIPTECNQNVTYNVIQGTSGSNNLVGTAGPDLIFGKGGADNIDGRAGNDCIVGGDGSDNLAGGTGDDVILGGDGSDAIAGDAGNDTLLGGSGNDFLSGGVGTDTIKGEGGIDAASGGANIDTCSAEVKVQCEL